MTVNSGQPVQSFNKTTMATFQSVFQKQGFFQDAFVTHIVDGIAHNQTMFSVKTQDIPVIINHYDTTVDLSSGQSRFGPVTEVIYEDTNVPFTHVYAINEAIDIFTVNNNFGTAVGNRIQLQAESLTTKWNKENAEFISSVAGETMDLVDLSEDALTNLFDNAAVLYTNLEVRTLRLAKVRQSILNALVNHGLITGNKGSTVNIDFNTLQAFKGFLLQAVPDHLFADGDIAYFYPREFAVFGIGIELARTITSENHAGSLIQQAGKNGHFSIEDNKKAVVRVTSPIAGQTVKLKGAK